MRAQCAAPCEVLHLCLLLSMVSGCPGQEWKSLRGCGWLGIQAIRPDEEADLPVDLPEEKSGRAKAKEDNEENAGQHIILSLRSCRNTSCSARHLF